MGHLELDQSIGDITSAWKSAREILMNDSASHAVNFSSAETMALVFILANVFEELSAVFARWDVWIVQILSSSPFFKSQCLEGDFTGGEASIYRCIFWQVVVV